MSPQPVWLSRHAHFCKLGTGIVVLNVSRDEFLNIEGVTAECLSRWLQGFPQMESEAAVSQLIAQGILTRSALHARDEPPVFYGASVADRALDANSPKAFHLRLGHILTFLWSLISTACALRFESLEAAFRGLERRKAQLAPNHVRDMDFISDLVAIFRRLRSFTFSGHRRCLLHAMTLVRFLAYYGVTADFVIGVKLEPWAAHSWVELGDYILDGTPEQARFYHRILVL